MYEHFTEGAAYGDSSSHKWLHIAESQRLLLSSWGHVKKITCMPGVTEWQCEQCSGSKQAW